MITSELLDDILLEWSYRLKDGIPDVNDPEKVKVLNEVLAEYKLPTYSELVMEGVDTAYESEGLCVYFSSLSKTELDEIESNLKLASSGKKYKPTKKLLTDVITAEYYGQAVKLVRQLVVAYNTNAIKPGSISRYANSLSMARYIHSKINSNGNVICDRGTFFKKIKERAHDIGKLAGIYDLKEDKWCPADIFIYANGKAPDLSESELKSITSINVSSENSPALNDLFIETFTTPAKKKILGISLKEEASQGGKAKSFTKTLKRGEEFPEDLGSLSKEQNLQKNISFFLDSIIEKYESKKWNMESERANAVSYAIQCKKILQSYDSTESLKAIKNDLDTIISNAIGKKNINMKDSDGKDLYKKDPKSFNMPKSFKENINSYYKEVLDTAYEFYETSRENLFSELESSGNYEFKNSEKISKTDASSPQTLLKKGACYQVAQELILGLNLEEFKIPPLYTNIAKDTNAFVALTAFGIGYAGMSPTFFKLSGETELGSIGHEEKFDGAGTLVLPESTTITIDDSPGYKGFRALFTVDVKVGDSVEKTYEITLTFRYSEITISIELGKPIEK